jgi:hypothetical protein
VSHGPQKMGRRVGSTTAPRALTSNQSLRNKQFKLSRQADSGALSLPVDRIVVGTRHRRDLGDIAELAANMGELGLLRRRPAWGGAMTAAVIRFPPRRSHAVWITRERDGPAWLVYGPAWLVLGPPGGWLHATLEAARAYAHWLAQNWSVPVREVARG